jgi:outer membrane lipase/esterase
MKYSILFILILINYVQTNILKHPFNTVVTFGDSHTDTGNVYNLTNYQWPLVPPYYQGRFTNGPVWIERLPIPFIQNYAYGDATIDGDNFLAGFTGPHRIKVPDIRQQIVTYLSTNNINTIDLSHTLYIIWAGGNEYLINSSLSPDLVVTNFLSTVYDLLVVGIQHLIIINLPPLQLYPGINKDEIDEELITEHNNYLLSNITQIQSDHNKVSIRVYDIYSLITNIISNNSMDMLNTIDKCWNIFNTNIISQCINPDEYVFIDDYHFTTVIHQVIAGDIQHFILSSALRTSSKFCIFICIILLILSTF